MSLTLEFSMDLIQAEVRTAHSDEWEYPRMTLGGSMLSPPGSSDTPSLHQLTKTRGGLRPLGN